MSYDTQDVCVRNSVRTDRLEVDVFYTLDELFAELDRLQCENSSLREQVEGLYEEMDDFCRKKSPYELRGLTFREFV